MTSKATIGTENPGKFDAYVQSMLPKAVTMFPTMELDVQIQARQ